MIKQFQEQEFACLENNNKKQLFFFFNKLEVEINMKTWGIQLHFLRNITKSLLSNKYLSLGELSSSLNQPVKLKKTVRQESGEENSILTNVAMQKNRTCFRDLIFFNWENRACFKNTEHVFFLWKQNMFYGHRTYLRDTESVFVETKHVLEMKNVF